MYNLTDDFIKQLYCLIKKRIEYDDATPSSSGLLSPSDKEKLDGIAEYATNTPRYTYMVGNAGGYIEYGNSKSLGYRKLFTVNSGKWANGYFAFTAFRRGGDSTRYCLNFDEFTGLLLSFRGYRDTTAKSVNSDGNHTLTAPAARSSLFLVKVSETSGTGGVYDVYMYCTPWGRIQLCNLYAPMTSVTFHTTDDIVVSSLPSGYIECDIVDTPIN